MAEKEYISREEIFKFPVRLNHYDVEALRNFIDNIPAADVAPVKHGHWEYDKHFRFARCSECEAEFYICDLEVISEGNLVNYCPNCGARMDEQEGNEK